jgi:hypothetical protein
MPDNLPTRKRTPKPLPPVEYLRERLAYYPESGELRWRKRHREQFPTQRHWLTWNTRYARTIAGYLMMNGYLAVAIDDRHYYAHRIIWKLFTGEEPPPQIDHRDGKRTNNAWDNLRAANQTEQNCNSILRNDNTSGHRGVSRPGNCVNWQARIIHKGIMHHLGWFPTFEEAVAAYEAAARELHGEFYRPP